MANVVVAENHLTFGGIAYFRGGAENAEIGSSGEKREPITKQNYLEVKDRIPIAKISMTRATVADIDFTKTSKSSFNTVVSAIIQGVPVQLSGGATFDKLKSGELKLVKFTVLNNDMRDAINSSHKALQNLIEWGNDARVVTQVFNVIEAKLANQFDNDVAVDLSIGVKGLEAKAGGSGSTSGETSVQISKNTCFAYMLAKIDWDANQKKNITKAVDLDDDQWSFS
jgi:hypothetical protein